MESKKENTDDLIVHRKKQVKSKSCKEIRGNYKKNSKRISTSSDDSSTKIVKLKDIPTFSSAPTITVSEKVKHPKRSKSEKKISKPSLAKENSKVGKIFGVDEVIDTEHPQFAPQPRHIRYFKLKKLFGQDIALEYIPDADTLLCSDDLDGYIEEKRSIDKSRRVKKFFGHQFDVSEAIFNARLRNDDVDNIETENPTVFVQPSYINIIKLNKFFGVRPNIQKRGKEDLIDFFKRRRKSEYCLRSKLKDHSSDDNANDNISNSVDDDIIEKKMSKPILRKSESSDSLIEKYRSIKPMTSKGYSSDNDEVYSIWEEESRELKTRRKLKSIFGVTLDLKDSNYKLYAPQPCNVKTYKLKKIFGSDVIVEHLDEPKKSKHEKKNKKDIKKYTEKRKSRKIKSFFGKDTFCSKALNHNSSKSGKKKKKKDKNT